MSEPSDAVARALAAFPRERQWLLPALHAVQHAAGALTDTALADVSEHLRVPLSEVWGVATHYPELRLVPRGRHHARICTGVSCALMGGPALLDGIARHWQVTPGAMGGDRELTLEATDCLFTCSMAPVIEVDGSLYGRVGTERIATLDDWFAFGRRHDGSAELAPAARQVSRAASAREQLGALVEQARATRRSQPRLLVQLGSCGRAVEGEAVWRALAGQARQRRLEVDVLQGACNGMCYAAPTVEVSSPQWPRAVIERLEVGAVGALLDQLFAERGDFGAAGLAGVVWADAPWRGLVPASKHPFWDKQERVVLARAGLLDPNSLDDALLAGGYAALAQALDGPPADVIAAVKAAGLQGRGGAFFPAALKWEACRAATGEPKYIVLNGEEGEPGIFKDRHIMEADPHTVLEGLLLAAYAAGATRAILYIHGEADQAARRLARALAQAQAAGIVGERVLGRDVACHVEVRRGAGGFVLGEETALLESIEGRRAQPRTRPPFPAESGLWGRPTVINNVETLAAVPAIVARGGAWFAGLGTSAAPGTKVFGLSGPLRRSGVIEVRNGMTLRTLLEAIGGGVADGRRLQGALVGGPSGSVVPASLFDAALEPRGQVSPGTGGVVAVPEGASVAAIVKTLVAFNANESCGKCTPCREGLPRLLAMIEELSTDPAAETRLRELAETIQLASLCGLGQAAPIAVLRGLEHFGLEFRRTRS